MMAGLAAQPPRTLCRIAHPKIPMLSCIVCKHHHHHHHQHLLPSSITLWAPTPPPQVLRVGPQPHCTLVVRTHAEMFLTDGNSQEAFACQHLTICGSYHDFLPGIRSRWHASTPSSQATDKIRCTMHPVSFEPMHSLNIWRYAGTGKQDTYKFTTGPHLYTALGQFGIDLIFQGASEPEFSISIHPPELLNQQREELSTGSSVRSVCPFPGSKHHDARIFGATEMKEVKHVNASPACCCRNFEAAGMIQAQGLNNGAGVLL